MSGKARVLYISYDGMGEPLGQSQVMGYLEGLADEFAISLLSFEKPGFDRAALATQMRSAGIDWHPLDYHGKPPVVSTLADVLRGAYTTRRLARGGFRPDLVHIRSYVPGCVALLSGRAPLIFDIRGFWADERVEGQLWPRDGLVDRSVRAVEHALFQRAAAVVTLTHASVAHIHSMTGDGDTPVRVIPTCTDVGRFAGTVPSREGPRVVWSGSIGPWYRFDLAVRIAAAMKVPMHVLTRQTAAASEAMTVPGVVKEVPPAALASEMREGDVGLCLYQQGFSAIARAPTKAAEYMAAGMPIAVTPGLGDLSDLVIDENVGVVVSGDEPSLEPIVQRLLQLGADQAVRDRCRKIARDVFDRPEGINAYRDLYLQLLNGSRVR